MKLGTVFLFVFPMVNGVTMNIATGSFLSLVTYVICD